MKYGNLNLLEPSGPLQACNGTDLTFLPLEYHLSGKTGTASRPDLQKIRVIVFFFENGLLWQLKFGCYYLQYVPFDHA